MAPGRNIMERRFEVWNIIRNLKDQNFTSKDDPIRELLVLTNKYIVEGERVKIDIPFPRIGKRIVGCLEVNKKRECVVILRQMR